MISFEEALQHIISARTDWGTEFISIEKGLGRILAEDIYADRNYPPFNRATMDGYAIKTGDILEKKISSFHVIGEQFAGSSEQRFINSGEAVKIMTGAPVPDGATAVIRKEDAVQTNGTVSFTVEQLKPYYNIALCGEDIQKGELVIPQHTSIDFRSVSVLASLGKNMVRVKKMPAVAILSTGNEIKPIDFPVEDFHIRDSNSYSISGFLWQHSIVPSVKRIVRDNVQSLVSTIQSLLEYDLLIISGGVSAGDADYVPSALRQCGVKEIFHKVKIKPGKPIWFGVHPNGLRVFALPGNPFAVQVACKIFIEPFLHSCFGISQTAALQLPISAERKKKVQFDELFPVALQNENGMSIIPHSFNGSGDISAVLNSAGIARHAAGENDLSIGAMVEFYPWKNFS